MYKKDEMNLWIRTPLESNKFFIVSWRMAGSEFCKELIRENYPQTQNINHWGKSHTTLDSKYVSDLLNVGTKVFVAITDPREVAMNLFYFDNGLHLHDSDYKNATCKVDKQLGIEPNFIDLLNDVTDKQIELINTYKEQFGDNCIIVRYEDALYYQNKFHNIVSKFLKTTPIGIDEVTKYKWSIYKNVGDFNQFFDENDLHKHYNQYKSFYEKWEYPKEGLQLLKYDWHGKTWVIGEDEL